MAGLPLQCTGSSASEAARLTFTGTGLSYLGMPLQDPGRGQPLVFGSQTATSRSVSVASMDTMQSQGSAAGSAAVDLSSAAGAGSILVSRGFTCSLALLPTGQLVVSNITNRAQPVPLWRSATPAQGSAPFRMVLSAAGSLAVLDRSGSGAGAWSSQTGCLLGTGPYVLQVGAQCACTAIAACIAACITACSGQPWLPRCAHCQWLAADPFKPAPLSRSCRTAASW
jgi:hypothetical protein